MGRLKAWKTECIGPADSARKVRKDVLDMFSLG